MTDLTPWPILKSLLFALDPEQAHRLTLALLAHWSALFAGRLAPTDPAHQPALSRTCLGLHFPNPIGLAAGLDKDGVAIPAWQAIGFGFIEVGTVTALPQPGNPKPRLFRFAQEEALVNRMGFNNAGAAALARRLERLRARGLPEVPLGVNLGKSKIVPLVQAAADYRQGFEAIAEFADYIVVNVSSPNTPGLRALQGVEEIQRILEAIQGPNQRLTRPRPLLVKLAPDLTDDEAIACTRAALAADAAGLILTNTTSRLEGLKHVPPGLTGGLSGRPLFARSTELVRAVRQAVGPEPVIIGVGGILDPEGARAKLAAGADLIQVYTGLIYRGPGLVRRLLHALAEEIG
ncbi:quinone-dependent dihydroorotate dehydrogenase [Caldichromatium japonicum]|uniref:Dihydroorotate dehydrogenase (quinone) n=1 Tax=Caldichromatium japonicum TaxID=2699430 RepID=A0A6G7VH94_9GAMM|nr:quinone-dependent dihydroorotate dehydrogenase [Caldichromatium japonicum]